MGLRSKTRNLLLKFLFPRLRSIANLSQADFVTKSVLAITLHFNQAFRLLPILRYSDVSTRLDEVAPTADFEVKGPNRWDQATSPSQPKGRMDALHARRFHNVVSCGYASALVANGTLAIPDHYLKGTGRTVQDGRFLLWQSDDKRGLLCTANKRKLFTHGISLFGVGTFNWYHWLIEQLPAAFLAERLPQSLADVPFVVPEHVLKVQSFNDSLSLFKGDRPVQTITQAPCQFETLYTLDSPIQEPIHMSAGRWPKPQDYAYHPEVMRAFRAAIIDRLEISIKPARQRVFLARPYDRRGYNQDEAIRIAAEFGFEVVYTEKLSFREQVELMLQAEFIIGPSGAAFANTLFCRPDTRLLSWLIPEYEGFCSYANIATITDSHLKFIFTQAHQEISTTDDAFFASYDLNGNEFRRALESMVKWKV